MLVLDLNKFKVINDSLGHLAGDAVLKATAQHLRTCTREGDVVARLGGDEFVIVARRVTSEEMLRVIKKRIQQSIANNPAAHEGRQIPFSVSVGFSLQQGTSASVASLLEAADQNLYEEKRSSQGLIPRA